MANICSNFMTITGDKDQLKELRDRIVSQDAGLIDLFTWFESQNKPGNAYGLIQDPEGLSDDTDVLSLDYTSKWDPPTEELVALSKEYPGLSIENRYEEPAMLVFGVSLFENGIEHDHTMNQDEYLTKFDDDYTAIVEGIQNDPYRSFLKEYIHGDDLSQLEDQYPEYGYLLETHILNRVQDKDLPLLIGHTWLNEKNQNQFEKRLRGTPSVPVVA